jgi:hypothetical protein
MLWLWLALTAGVMITSHITKARGDKPSRACGKPLSPI